MPKIINLADRIKKHLPAELVYFLQVAGETASSQEYSLYLVGGVVRDLLLGRNNFDLDIVVEGDAINLASRLTQVYAGKITTHPRFKTAKLQWDNWSVDLTTARSETYAKPGALPSVKPGTLQSDLFRRDFTINAMAIHLAPSRYGELIDLYEGLHDLEHKLIRILHEKSFIDDATRIWRSLRYEQRLNFQLDETTLKLLKRDVPMLDTISSDRIRHELELVLKEELPEKVLRRATELRVLHWLYSPLKGDDWLADRFEQARQLCSPNPTPTGLYLALLACRLTNAETEQLIAKLRLTKSLGQTLRDTSSIKARLKPLADPTLPPSSIYHLLHGYSPVAITTSSLASDSPIVRQHMQLFLNKLRYVKPALTGDDLQRMGIPAGPRIKEILQLLHEARLDGKVTSKQREEEVVKGWIAQMGSS